MMSNNTFDSLKAHLKDLHEKSERWHTHTHTHFLTEEEQAVMQRYFPASCCVKYDGGYPEAFKKEVIFLYDEEDDFSDIVCLTARIDQRFRKIGHRDVYGALMHLQIEKSAFGDFWVEDDRIVLYTCEDTAGFLEDNLNRINQLTVKFERTEERPEQLRKYREFTSVAASERADAIVAAITHESRAKAKEMIRQGYVSLNHVILEQPDEVCHNNVTISIRGFGRYIYCGYERTTKSDRIAAIFRQYL